MVLKILLVCVTLATLRVGLAEVFNIPLNSEAGYKLYWSPNYEQGSIKFEVHLTPSLNKGDWFAVGFSNYGGLTYADYCLVLRDENGHYSIQVGPRKYN